jgi:hypothetical protein
MILWLAAGAVVLASAFRRFAGAVDAAPGYDLELFYLPAARAVASGGSPYGVDGYVYSPLVAWILAPLADWTPIHVVWPAANLVAGVLAAVLVALDLFPDWRRDWRAPVLFGVAGFTAMSNWFTTHEMDLGQIQLVVMLVLVIAWRERRRRPWLAGAMMGLAGGIKTWPGLVVVWAFSRRADAWRLLAGAGAVVVAVVVATVVGLGPGAMGEWLGSTSRFSQQPQPVFSAWGVWRHLFADGTRIDPLLVSPVLRLVFTALALALVLALLGMSLWRSRDDSLAFWHVTACCILLLPVAHFGYLLVPLPLLWIRLGMLLRRPSSPPLDWISAGALMLWWVLCLRNPWTLLDTPTYLLMLGSTALALTLSVAADRSGRSTAAAGRATSSIRSVS